MNTRENESIIHHDEPATRDRLNRGQYARAFARLAETCQTPLVIGIYGAWGVGKTSLMKLIEGELDQQKNRTVWFDAWQHQFDENPVVALAHLLVNKLDPNWMREGKKMIRAIGSAFASTLLQKTSGFNIDDIDKFGKMYEEERFQIRDVRVRLREHFKHIIEKTRQAGGVKKRLVFFIDDLDRCMPDEAMKLIESLKLYLNIEGCIYFLGVDRTALEHSINQRYQEMDVKEADYLDKIIQLPFTVPPIEPGCMSSFVAPLLSPDLQTCRGMLVKNLGSNPRQVKRFINTLTFNHQLADGLNIPDYNPRVLTLLLLIQLQQTKLYKRIAAQPDLLKKLKQKTGDVDDLFEKHLAANPQLHQAMTEVKVPRERVLKAYIYLTSAVGVIRDVETDATFSPIDLLSEEDGLDSLMRLILRRGGITAGEAAEELGRTAEKARRDLEDLVEEGRLKRLSLDGQTRYKAVFSRKQHRKGREELLKVLDKI
ncbi:MAG: hypothetical protein GY859_01365 [Desulfobacterales bacterium]|nr:hypothetical protein [Desulfobacterales bacterium]